MGIVNKQPAWRAPLPHVLSDVGRLSCCLPFAPLILPSCLYLRYIAHPPFHGGVTGGRRAEEHAGRGAFRAVRGISMNRRRAGML